MLSLQAWEVLQQPGLGLAPGYGDERSTVGFEDICFIDEQKGWAVGAGGVIIHTEDGGETWAQQNVDIPLNVHISSIYFVDEKYGWATGFSNPTVMGGDNSSFILSTDNGGEIWQVFKTKKIGWGSNIQFINNKEGWVCGRLNGAIWHTEDGGKTWDIQYTTEERCDWWEMFFLNAQKGWVVGRTSIKKGEEYDTIMATKDGGKSWQVQYYQLIANDNAARWKYSVWFVNEQEGWVAIGAEKPILLHTKNGGETWEKHQFNSGAWWDSIQFINQKEGWIAGSEKTKSPIGGKGLLFHTKDSGVSWEIQTELETSISQIRFISAQEGWAASLGNFVLHTTDGGKEWEYQVKRKPDLRNVCFIDARLGWAVGLDDKSKVVILHTEDGGRSWHKQPCELPIGEDQRLEAIHFVDSQHGWAGGSVLGNEITGVLLQTNDGGESWSVKKSGYMPHDLYFSDFQNGWMVAKTKDPFSMKFVRTEDGGRNWRERRSVVRDGRATGRIQCLDAQRYWMMAKGLLYYTLNDGKTWEQEKVPDISAFYFLDDKIGWFGNDQGIYHTKNGRRDYSYQRLPMPIERLSDIYFKDRWEGWCLGNRYNFFGNPMERGIIFHTLNSGKAWKVELKSPQNLHRFGYASGQLWVVGDNGAVYGMETKAVSAFGKQSTTWGKVKTALFQNYPNPFNPDTWIPYRLAKDADVTITIYNVKGETIRILRLRCQSAGTYITKKQAAYWDGRDDEGSPVASGLYFYTLQVREAIPSIGAGNFTATKKLAIIK